MPAGIAIQLPKASQSRLARWLHLLGRFAAGQLTLQFITVATGLLLIHLLSVEQYACFGVAFAFQGTISALVDVGFSNSIVALVGHRGEDPNVIGGFIRSAQHYRNRMFAFIAIAALVAFPLVTHRQPWGAPVKAGLLAAVLSTVFLQRQMMYSAPLLIHRRIVQYYSAQITANLARLATVVVLYELHLLTAVAAAWLTTLMVAVNGLIYRAHARSLVREPKASDPLYNREMIKYIMPLAPGIVFFAFQGQIAVGLITIFGKSRNIAEVAALSRLGQLFLILSAANSVLIEPYFARLPRALLATRYALCGAGALAISGIATAAAFAWPAPLLLLLGRKYQNLAPDIGWMMLGSCFAYATTVFWFMNSARKFVYWWYTMANIILVLISQVVCFFALDLSTTRGAIYFIIATNASSLLVHFAAGCFGIYTTRPGTVSADAVPVSAKVN